VHFRSIIISAILLPLSTEIPVVLQNPKGPRNLKLAVNKTFGFSMNSLQLFVVVIFALHLPGLTLCLRCDGGNCFNPYEKGCLISIAEDRNEVDKLETAISRNRFQEFGRVCNSNDEDDNNSHCDKIDLSYRYDEVRIAPGNWESSLYLSWILQILLSELMRVPTTIELGLNDKKHESAISSFYDRESRITYPDLTYGWDSLKEAHLKNGSCEDAEKPCAHIIPEMWYANKNGTRIEDEEYIFLTKRNGLTGQMGYYIPKFTAKKHPEFVSHFGLSNKPQKLSEVFKTPISWGEYCSSTADCSDQNKNEVATRQPSDSEKDKYFVDGFYKGFFKDNKCDINNVNDCNGHFVNIGCKWTSFAESQFYWQNISLASAGPLPNGAYSGSQLIEIMNASNATKSDVLLWWYEPEILHVTFDKTPMELQRVELPHATPACLEHRAEHKNEICSAILEERQGSAVGSCDYPFLELKMAISAGLNSTVNEGLNVGNVQLRIAKEMLKSPSLDFLSSFEMGALSMKNLMNGIPGDNTIHRIDRDDYEMGFVSRKVVCTWVYDNIDDLIENIPTQYPRFFQRTENKILFGAALWVGILTILSIIIITMFALKLKMKETVKFYGVDCWIWILFGFTLNSAIAVLQLFGIACGVAHWFTMFGYIFELAPILIKQCAINKSIRHSHVHQGADIQSKSLNKALTAIILLTIALLAVGSILEPRELMTLARLKVPGDEHNVSIGVYCAAKNSSIWRFVNVIIVSIMLCVNLVLACQSRRYFDNFEESQGLSLMIFSHIVFIVIRSGFMYVEKVGGILPSSREDLQSLLCCLDVLFAMPLYFGPKFSAALNPRAPTSKRGLLSTTNTKAREDPEEEECNNREEELFSLNLEEMPPISSLARTHFE